MKKDDIIKPNEVSELVLCKDDFDEDFNLVIGAFRRACPRTW